MPPRKFGIDRHPDGSPVRTFWAKGQTVLKSLWPDETKAKSNDPRENSAAGRLERKLTHEGGITKHERLAGEQYAELVTRVRKRILCSPNPNPPACDLQRANGKALERDPNADEIEKLRKLKEHAEEIERKLHALPNRRMVRKTIHDIFIMDEDVAADRVPHARRGLKLLFLELGLTGGRDRLYR